jgi:putative spermidine/putrescine transport system ATP-binding protein
VQAFIRPHRIRLLSTAEAADNALDGTIAALDYTGEVIQIVVDTPSGRVPVDLSTASGAWRGLRPGASVRVGWSAADTLCFPA